MENKAYYFLILPISVKLSSHPIEEHRSVFRRAGLDVEVADELQKQDKTKPVTLVQS